MAKFQLEKKLSKKLGKKFIFSQHDGDNWAGPCIEHFPAQDATRFGVYTEDGKHKFELNINNKEGTDYTIRLCNKDGYPLGPAIVVFDGCAYFGKFSSREGFNGTVYRFKKGDNVRIQHYSHGVLVDENIHEYVLKSTVAYPLPFSCVCEAEGVNEIKTTNKDGDDVIEYIAGNPRVGNKVLGASIDSEGAVTLGEYIGDGFYGIAMKYLPNGMIYFRTFTRGKVDGEFEFAYSSGELNGVKVNGYALVVKKDDEAGFLDFIYREKNNKFFMSLMELNSRRKPIKETLVEFPNEVDKNAARPSYAPTTKGAKNQPVDTKTGEELLNGLIGLDSVKKEVAKMKAMFAKFKGSNDINMNMVFYGNPGTGKTEVARIIAKILYEEKLLPSEKLVETDSSGLIAKYVGQSAPKTHEIFEKALGGVLFIDEAYNLNSGAVGDGNGFGEEAIAALLTDMENYRGQICVILAGYEAPMKEMIGVNQGFASRIGRYITFPNYSADELKQIALLMSKHKGYGVEDDALNEMGKILDLYSKHDNFANAREVRNLLESLYEIQALRTVEIDPNNMIITLADVLDYEKDHDISFAQKRQVKKKVSINPDEIVSIANNYTPNSFVFDANHLQECSVNIKVQKDGIQIGEGSGFFISPKGEIGTCAHVVNGADKIIVIVNIPTASGQIINKDYVADLVAIDKKTDVAIIKIANPEIEFSYYPLAEIGAKYPALMSDIAMGGYPFGGDRFEKITLTQGKIQSINKDNNIGDDITRIYVDLSGQPGSSGSGVIDKETGVCIGIFAGAAVRQVQGLTLTINYALPIQYLWDLLAQQDVKLNKIVDKTSVTASAIRKERFDLCEYERIPKKKKGFENVQIVKGDISTFVGDAIVNAANQYLAPGSGVCGAIFDAAGYRELQKECERIGGCEVGKAVITNGYNLKSDYIIHAVGPHYFYNEYPEELLESAYESCFKIALEKNIRSIALPSISTGAFRFPVDKAIPIALKVIKKYAPKMDEICVYCFGSDSKTYDSYIQHVFSTSI